MDPNQEKYLSLLHGVNQSKQWYEMLHGRLDEEKKLFLERYPNFKFSINKDGFAEWIGEIGMNDESWLYKIPQSVIYNPLKIKIICRIDYPLSFPQVVDVNSILKSLKCEHVMGENSICYAFGSTSGIDFTKDNRVVDVVPVIQAFLLKFYCKQTIGIWPGGEHLHGSNAFIAWEFDNGSIQDNEICPCRMHGKTYRDCHWNIVQNRLSQLRSFNANWVKRVDVGRNDLCLCGSGYKFKKCGFLGKCNITAYYYHLIREMVDNRDTLINVLKRIPLSDTPLQ